MTHTPEPWEQAGSIIWSPSHGVICELSEPRPENGWIYHERVSISSPDWDEAMDNGRLIKAAPALLRTLKSTYENLKMMVSEGILEYYNFDEMNTVIVQAENDSQ